MYGTDKDKETLTPYLWENLPLYLRERYSDKKVTICNAEHVLDPETSSYVDEIDTYIEPQIGQLSVRRLLQILGTDIFREMFDQDIWVKTAFRKIKSLT